MTKTEEAVDALMEEYQKKYFEDNGYVMNGQQKRVLRRKLQKLVEKRMNKFG